MTLYHYCSAATFESIVRSKSIWLSSLSQSNDTHEGLWMDGLLRQVCAENEFTPSEIDRASEFLKDATAFWDVLGLCLTPNDDMLSQWRGYADDGCGFAIGFRENSFRRIHADKGRLVDLIYDADIQLQIVRNAMAPKLDFLRKNIQALSADQPTRDGSAKERFRKIVSGPEAVLGFHFLSLINIIFVLKNPSFREENETRFITNISREYPDCAFHLSGRKLVPHRSIEFSTMDPAISIERVVLGPSNPTPPNIVAAFLRENGFEDTSISSSAATYRSRF